MRDSGGDRDGVVGIPTDVVPVFDVKDPTEETFCNNPSSVIPVPSSAVLASSAAGFIDDGNGSSGTVGNSGPAGTVGKSSLVNSSRRAERMDDGEAFS